MGREDRNTLSGKGVPTRAPGGRPCPFPMPDLRPLRMPHWIDEELATLDLGDDRSTNARR